MSIQHSREVHLSKMIIDRGEYEVDNHFRRVNILASPSQECSTYFAITLIKSINFMIKCKHLISVTTKKKKKKKNELTRIQFKISTRN